MFFLEDCSIETSAIETTMYIVMAKNSAIIFTRGNWKIAIFLNAVSARTNGVNWIMLPNAFGIASMDIIMLDEIKKIIPIHTEAITPVSSELNVWPITIPVSMKNELVNKIEVKVKLNGRAIPELKNNFVIPRSIVVWIKIMIKAVKKFPRVNTPFEVGVNMLLKYALVFLSFIVKVDVSRMDANIIVIVINPGRM